MTERRHYRPHHALPGRREHRSSSSSARYENDLDAYIFVANFLTRRIHERYVKKMEAAFGARYGQAHAPGHHYRGSAQVPRPGDCQVHHLRHDRSEMRKYNVTLLVIDQRPSQIDADVMSQIATRITGRMNDADDIAAIFAGVEGADGLRSVLSRPGEQPG